MALRAFCALSFVLLCFTLVATASSSDELPSAKSFERPLAQNSSVFSQKVTTESLPTPIASGWKWPAPGANRSTDDAAKLSAIYLDYLAAVSQHNENMQKIEEQQYNDQRFVGGIIFILVIMIVVVGVGLSILQFFKGVLLASPASNGPAGTSASGATTNVNLASEITVSLTSVEIKSSVIGLVVLAVSLAFFFLYIKYVYAITP